MRAVTLNTSPGEIADKHISDKGQIVMNAITTTAPISMNDIKKYFEDNTTSFQIEYAQSSIKGPKLIIYLSNLDLPCDVMFANVEDLTEMVVAYMQSSNLVKIPSVEQTVAAVLSQSRGLTSDPIAQDVLSRIPTETVELWNSILDSLTVYNMLTIPSDDVKQWVKDSFPTNETSDLIGINFANLLKYESTYTLFQTIEERRLAVYSKFFNEYVFKGKNLYAYWATTSNPLFLLTAGIASGALNPTNCAQETI